MVNIDRLSLVVVVVVLVVMVTTTIISYVPILGQV